MDNRERLEYEKKLRQLETQLAELQLRWPAHSVKPSLILQREELEEGIEAIKEHLKGSSDGEEVQIDDEV